jgi:hypothetical protein
VLISSFSHHRHCVIAHKTTTYTHTHTLDNGQHFGDHRIPAGKRQAYETDVNVPFFVRGPGIPKGTSSPQVVQSVDLGPTFLDVASSSSSSSSSAETLKAPLLRSSYPMDGQSFLPLLTNQRSDDDTSASNNQKNSNNINAKSYNDFRWAALLEMYSGSSNIGTRYKDMKEYHQNHMVRKNLARERIKENYLDWFDGSSFLSHARLLSLHSSVVARPGLFVLSIQTRTRPSGSSMARPN